MSGTVRGLFLAATDGDRPGETGDQNGNTGFGVDRASVISVSSILFEHTRRDERTVRMQVTQGPRRENEIEGQRVADDSRAHEIRRAGLPTQAHRIARVVDPETDLGSPRPAPSVLARRLSASERRYSFGATANAARNRLRKVAADGSQMRRRSNPGPHPRGRPAVRARVPGGASRSSWPASHRCRRSSDTDVADSCAGSSRSSPR